MLVLHSIFISSGILLITFFNRLIWNKKALFPAWLCTGKTGIDNPSNLSFISRSLTMTALRKHPDYDVCAETHYKTFILHTVTRRQRMAPEVVFLTNQWLLVAQSVSRVTLEWHCGPDGQVCVRPRSVDWDTRIHARVRVQRDHCRNVKVQRTSSLFCTIISMNMLYFTILMLEDGVETCQGLSRSALCLSV